MANVRSIAKRAGVSITTVSRVLNNHPQVSPEVRQRVLTASNETGYTPNVGRRSTMNIALVYTGASSLGSPFDAALMSGIWRGVEESGYDLMVLDAERSRLPNETFTQMLMRKGVRGALLRTTASARPICQTIIDEGFPTVLVADRLDSPNVNYVYCDSLDASREAIEHLIGLGHRRIGICVNIVEDSDHVDRLAGYQQALRDHGLEFDSKMVMRVPAEREGGAQLLRRLMTKPDRPTAVFLTDPMTAVGAMSEARKMGVKIPNDLSVVGFDDAEVRYSVCPELTAVCQDASTLGMEAFAALRSLIERDGEGGAAPRIRKALRTWLEVHESTAPVDAALATTAKIG